MEGKFNLNGWFCVFLVEFASKILKMTENCLKKLKFK